MSRVLSGKIKRVRQNLEFMRMAKNMHWHKYWDDEKVYDEIRRLLIVTLLIIDDKLSPLYKTIEDESEIEFNYSFTVKPKEKGGST